MAIYNLCVLIYTLLGPILSRSTAFTQVERITHLPDGWEQEEAAPDPSAKIDFGLAIQDTKLERRVQETLLQVSTPGHRRHGQHLTREELRALTDAEPETIDAVVDWLTEGGVNRDDIRPASDWVGFTTSVENAEKLMDTVFYRFRDSKTNTTTIRTWEYSVPNLIAPSVRLVQPTTRITRFKGLEPLDVQRLRSHSKNVESDPCDTTTTPTCLRNLYGFSDSVATPRSENKLGVSGFLEQHAQETDFQRFLERFAPPARNATFSVKFINGGENRQNSTGNTMEANLDVQYAAALSYDADIVYYSTGGRGEITSSRNNRSEISNTNEPYLDQLRYLIDLPDGQLPAVLTTSYGEPERSVPENYARTVCDLFGRLGARGVSVIFSSGDSGVGSACRAKDDHDNPRFDAIFPASCPYVTSVGATGGTDPERALDFSSGGFSDLFDRPAYQDKAVGQYLSRLGSQWDGLFSRRGRGFPDIAAQGTNFAIFNKGEIIKTGGTSASAPVIAAIISHLNDVRLSQGKKVLGFLNPWLYESGHRALTDIVDGGSRGCSGFDRGTGRSAPFVPYASWNATRGWDPVTGFGTPNFERLIATMP